METGDKSETGPRYEHRLITWAPGFLSRLGELDVWIRTYDDGETYVYVVGPEHRRVRPHSGFNHDRFLVTDNGLENDEDQDLHIELYEMCLLYQLCQEHGILKIKEAA